MSNIRQFKNLIKKYESITLEQLNNPRLEWMSSKQIMNCLTGYGDTGTCSLCIQARKEKLRKAVVLRCDCCFWVIATGLRCNIDENSKTYNAIEYAQSRTELLEAVKQRARYMRKVLEKYENE